MLTLMGATRDTGRTLAESLLNVGKYVRALVRLSSNRPSWMLENLNGSRKLNVASTNGMRECR